MFTLRLMRNVLFMLLLSATSLTLAVAQEEQSAQPARKIEVVVKRVHGDLPFYDIWVDGFVRGTPQQVWKILTDYDQMHMFVPDMVSSKVLSRDAGGVVVAQEGRVRFFFFSKTVHLVLRVTELPFSRIDIALMSGDMKQYASHWELFPMTQDGVTGTRISYTGKLEPDFFAPSLFGSAMVESSVRKMVEAMMLEMVKTQTPALSN